MAAWTGNISNVSLLLDIGCDINSIATRSHNFGKSPIFFACTRSRKDVVNLLLDRGANVLIVNNKGQSVYSIACSHFEIDLIERIKQIETEQQDMNRWVNYRETHSDGNVYGDLDLRFLGRELTNDDVVKDGVVNPTTKQSRKGNFARNNPNSYNSRKNKNDTKAKKKEKPRVSLTEDEQIQLEKLWDEVQAAFQVRDSWEIFSSLLGIVKFIEDKKIQSRWVVESASRLDFMVRLQQTLGEITFDNAPIEPKMEETVSLCSALTEAAVFCGSGDRHATLVKRILTKAEEGKDETNRQQSEILLTDQENKHLEQFWHDIEIALKNKSSRDAYIPLLKVVVFWDTKDCSWLTDATTKFHSILGSDSFMDDITVKEILSFCENNNYNRHATLLKKMITKAPSNNIQTQAPNNGHAVVENRQTKKKEHTLPDHYHAIMKSLNVSAMEDKSTSSWSLLMNAQTQVNGETSYLSLPQAPLWVDTVQELQCLQSKLHSAIDDANHGIGCDEEVIRFDNLIAFDSEFRSEEGSTRLATIQFSLLEEGQPLAWVVDLYPKPSNTEYSSITQDILRWLFLESNASLLGFSHRHDIHMISSYVGEEIQLRSPKLIDLQLIAAHKMAKDAGNSCNMASLPGLKSCCSYFLNSESNTQSWELSKAEQCSDWARRPLTSNQLEYAGLDAAVLLVLLAEIVRN